MNIVETLIAMIAPHTCIACEEEGSLLCYRCRLTLPLRVGSCYRCHRLDATWRTCSSCRRVTPLTSAQSVTSYESVARNLVHALKYDRKRQGAQVIAELMATHYAAHDSGLVVAHVPTVAARVRVRGYDQAEEIAHTFAALKRLPYAPLLIRQGTQRQVGQDRVVRIKQMKQAFRTSDRPLPTRVLLIDDVFTTGATIEAAARALRAAGVRQVHALVFAAA